MEGRVACKQDNALFMHDCLHHPTKISGGAEYFMELDKQFMTPLQRQSREMILIESRRLDILMNSKSEYNGSKVPRVVIEGEGERMEKK